MTDPFDRGAFFSSNTRHPPRYLMEIKGRLAGLRSISGQRWQKVALVDQT